MKINWRFRKNWQRLTHKQRIEIAVRTQRAYYDAGKAKVEVFKRLTDDETKQVGERLRELRKSGIEC
jgi:hypothetical protein